MKKIAVCGYSSSVGRYFLEQYQSRFEFVRIGRGSPDVRLDLRRRELDGDLRRLEGCDALVNLAAHTGDRSFGDIMDMMQTNVLGPVFLANLARERGIGRLIHVSSISATYVPGDPYYGYYAQSKKSADEMLELFCGKNNLSCCILRPSGLFGTEAFAAHQKLLYGMRARVIEGKPVTLYGKNDAVRNYIHVATLAEVISRLVDSDVAGVYNVVNLQNSRLTEIVEALNRYYNGHSEVVFLPEKGDIPSLALSDSGEIYRLLGMKAPKGFESELLKGKVEPS